MADGSTRNFAYTIEQRKRTRWDGTKHHAAGNSRAQYNLQNRFRTRLISDNTVVYTKEIGALKSLLEV